MQTTQTLDIRCTIDANNSSATFANISILITMIFYSNFPRKSSISMSQKGINVEVLCTQRFIEPNFPLLCA